MNDTIAPKFVRIYLPADSNGGSIDATVLNDVVNTALFEVNPVVALNHVWGAFNTFREATDRGALYDELYKTAVALAAYALRYAHEHKPDAPPPRRRTECVP